LPNWGNASVKSINRYGEQNIHKSAMVKRLYRPVMSTWNPLIEYKFLPSRSVVRSGGYRNKQATIFWPFIERKTAGVTRVSIYKSNRKQCWFTVFIARLHSTATQRVILI